MGNQVAAADRMKGSAKHHANQCSLRWRSRKGKMRVKLEEFEAGEHPTIRRRPRGRSMRSHTGRPGPGADIVWLHGALHLHIPRPQVERGAYQLSPSTTVIPEPRRRQSSRC